MTARRLSPTQIKILAAMNAGQELAEHFDVYGGYWNTLGEEPVRKSTMEALFYGRLIEKTKPARVYSGRHKMLFKLTDAGRALAMPSGQSEGK
jgi:hypothetical protein